MDRSEILGGWALPPDAWLAVVGRSVDHLWRRRIQVTEEGLRQRFPAEGGAESHFSDLYPGSEDVYPIIVSRNSLSRQGLLKPCMVRSPRPSLHMSLADKIVALVPDHVDVPRPVQRNRASHLTSEWAWVS